MAFCSAAGGPADVIGLPESTPVTVPPLVQAPLPLEPSRENLVALITVIVNVPFAAVFPSTPAMLTCWPSW
jgi:hypothetical protein